ncbi:MAG: phosphomannomutase/phosphoglucomutase [Candidatus Moraniibacteriota bacterium]|nr:MAG: phosphomannomutase/phosphoglucomutase [Candidatus Moranbacteria bacterium]
MNPGIFKAYDIRGVYGPDIDDETAYRIGRALIVHFQATKIAVGRDVRASSPALFEAFTRGVMDQGGDVVDLGVVTTPMVHFAAGRLDVDLAVAITASHNPPEYNGIKVDLKGAIPVGEKTGLSDIRDLVLANNFPESTTRGTLTEEDIRPAYYAFFASFGKLGDRRFTLAIDTANAMGIVELPIYDAFKDNLTIYNLYNDLSQPFSAHEANPLKTETLDELCALVKEKGADMGIAYDGDADRIGFVDEHGVVIPMDLITGLVAQIVLEKNPGATILYDLRSSRAVKEAIESKGGRAIECRVGHAFIKRQMRDDGAIFAGELSGHYYFVENSYAEASTLVAIHLLNLMAETGRTLSELVGELRRYVHSGEINSEVEDKDAVLMRLREKYADGKQHDLDGLKIEYPDWWFNVRPSNTEPLLRLTMEADTEAHMIEKRDELLAIIRG